MVFFALEYIFKIAFIIFICEVILFMIFTMLFGIYENIILYLVKKKLKLYLNSTKKNRNRLRNVFNKHFDNGLMNFKLIALFSFIFIIPSSNNLLLFFPTLLIYFIYYIERISKMESLSFSLVMASGIIVISVFVTTLYNSYNKRFEKDNTLISFIRTYLA